MSGRPTPLDLDYTAAERRTVLMAFRWKTNSIQTLLIQHDGDMVH